MGGETSKSLVQGAKEALAIAEGEMKPAGIFTPETGIRKHIDPRSLPDFLEQMTSDELDDWEGS